MCFADPLTLLLIDLYSRDRTDLIDRPCTLPGQRHHLCIDLSHRELEGFTLSGQFLT